jgi:plastocyanin
LLALVYYCQVERRKKKEKEKEKRRNTKREDFTNNNTISFKGNHFMLTISSVAAALVILAAILILGIAAVTTTVVDGQQQQQSNPTTNNGGVHIVNHSLVEVLPGFTAVVGEVRNNNSPDSPNPRVGLTTINGKFYNSTGHLIYLGTTYAMLTELRPGEKSPFKMLITDSSVPERLSNYTLSIDPGPTFVPNRPAALEVEVVEQGTRDRPYGGPLYQIIGNVANAGNHSTTGVQVIATFYDETGKVIGVETTGVVPSVVTAGQSADFIMNAALGNRTPEDIKSVKLTVQSVDYLMIDPELEQVRIQGIQQRQPQQQQEEQHQVRQQNQVVSVSIVPGSSSLTDTAYQPNPVQVSVGDTVTWTNDDTQPHTVTSGQNGQPDGRFDSSPNFNPLLAPGDTFSHTFTEAGQYPYYCALHPNQVGRVTVIS